MRILVSGGAGFVGSHLTERLLNDGHEVICLDNLSTGRRRNLATLEDRSAFRFIEHDVVVPLPDLPRFDWIFHLASPASPPAYQSLAIETLRVNTEGTRRLLELARQNKARFFFASTSEVYGDPLEHPQQESYRGNVSPNGPRSMYDEAKRCGEAMTTAYAESMGVDVRIVRIFNTYGPRMDINDGRVVSNFICQALQGEPITIYGDGTQTRSFQFVDDLVEGMLRLMESHYRWPVNIGNPVEYTMLDLAELIVDLTGTKSPLVYRPLPHDDPKRRQPDITLARTVLHWHPVVPVLEGLRRTVAYFQAELAEVAAPALVSPFGAAFVESHAGLEAV